jgi:hypothetical protein
MDQQNSKHFFSISTAFSLPSNSQWKFLDVVHSLIIQAKVIYQDQKDFNNEIKNL